MSLTSEGRKMAQINQFSIISASIESKIRIRHIVEMVDQSRRSRVQDINELNTDLQFKNHVSPLTNQAQQQQTPAKAQIGRISQNPFNNKASLHNSIQSSEPSMAETPGFNQRSGFAFQKQNPSDATDSKHFATNTSKKQPDNDSYQHIQTMSQVSPNSSVKRATFGVGGSLENTNRARNASDIKQISGAQRSILKVTTHQPSPASKGKNDLQIGKGFRLQYESMPKGESELDSDRQTIDGDRNRELTKKQASAQDYDGRSDQTLYTEKVQAQDGDDKESILSPQRIIQDTERNSQATQAQHITKPGSSCINAEEQSIYTQAVLNSGRVQEQDDYQNAVNLQLEHEPIDVQTTTKDQPKNQIEGSQETMFVNDRQIKPNVLARAHHQQSQSLEQLPSMRELKQREETEGGTRNKLVQARNAAIQKTQFKASHQANQDKMAESDSIHNRSQIVQAENRGHHMLVSEFAITESHQQDPLVRERDQMGSIDHGQDSLIQYSGYQVEKDSVTDSNMLDTKTQRVPVTLETYQEQSASEVNAQPSITEKAASVLGSIDARGSDMIKLGPFEEEKSTDLKQNSEYQSKQMIVSRQSIKASATEQHNTPSEARNSQSNQATPDYQDKESSVNQVSQKKDPTNQSSNVDYYSDDKFDMLSSQPVEIADIKNATVSSVRAPTESQDADRGQEEFYESLNASQDKEEADDVTKNFVDQDFNPSVQQSNQAQQNESMVIIEESKHINTDEPIFEQSASKRNHKREIKSFDITASPQQHLHSTNNPNIQTPLSHNSQQDQQKSGVEQYESDGEFATHNQYSSIQQTSATIDAPPQPPKFSMPNSLQAPSDSMAYETQIGNNQASDTMIVYEQEGPPVSQPETNQQIRIEGEIETAAKHSVQILDQNNYTDNRIAETDQQRISFDSRTKMDGLKTQGDLPTQKNEQGSCQQIILDSNVTVKEMDTGTQSRVSRETPIVRGVMRSKQSVSQPSSQQIAPEQKIKNKRTSQEKRKSKSPKRTRSPQGKIRNSKSPADRKVTIQNGKIVFTNSRDAKLNQHQFPIRRSNYDQGTVERMLLSKQQFNKSVSILKKMKTRILKYNKDFSNPRQNYFGRQSNPNQSLQSVQDSIDMPNGNSIEFYQSIESQDSTMPIPVDGKNRAHAQTANSLITNEDQSFFPNSNLPQFLKEMSKPRPDIDAEQQMILADGRVSNIIVENSRVFQDKRHSNSQSTIGPSYDDQNLHSVNKNTLSENLYEVVPQTADGDQRYENAQVLAASYEMQMLQQNSRAEQIHQSNSMNKNPLAMSPDPKQDFRFGKPNKLLVEDQRNSVTANHKKETYLDAEQSAYNTGGLQSSQVKSTRSQAGYPQDNLSLLLHAASSYPAHELPTSQVTRGNLMYKQQTQSQVPGHSHRNKSENQLGKIYSRTSNGHNIQLGSRVLNHKKQPQLKKSIFGNKGARITINQRTQSKPIESNEFDTINEETASFQQQQVLVQSQYQGLNPEITAQIIQSQKGSQKNLQTGKNTLQPRRNSSLQPASENHMNLNQEFSRKDTAESANEKFQRWLSKGRPISNLNAAVRGRRNVFGHLKSGSPIASGELCASQINPSHRYFNNLDVRQTQDESDQAILGISSISQPMTTLQNENQNMNLSMAVKFLNDPNFGETAAERKIKLRSYIIQNYPEKFISMPQPQMDPITLQQSLDRLTNQQPQGRADRFRNSLPKYEEKFLAHDSNSRTFEKTLSVEKQATSSMSNLPYNHVQNVRGSYQQPPRRQFVVPTEQVHSLNNDKLNHLSQIYAVPQGKKRTTFLTNNYVKGGHLIQLHLAKNNRLAEARKSRSPKVNNEEESQIKHIENRDRSRSRKKQKSIVEAPSPGLEEKDQEKGSSLQRFSLMTSQRAPSKLVCQQAYRALKAQNKKSKNSVINQGKTETQSKPFNRSTDMDEKPQSSNTQSQKQQVSLPVSRIPSRTSMGNRMSGQAAQQRHKHHVKNVETLNMEDTFEHPQISLNMPLSNPTELSKETPQEIDDPVMIDKDQIEMLSLEHDNEADSERDEPEPVIDHLQERDVVEQDYSQDLPQVLAEDDKNPNIPEQQDQILGEQTISEDEAGEARQVAAASQHNQNNPDSFRLPIDSDRSNPDLGPSQQQVEQTSIIIEQQEEQSRMLDSDGYNQDKFETESLNNTAVVDVQKDQESKPVSSQKIESSNKEEGDDDDDDEDYYADDKFVYEDEAELPSSEDPEQKFLKKQAEGPDNDQVIGQQEMVKGSKNRPEKDTQNSIELAVKQQERRTSQSHMAQSATKGLKATSSNEQSQDDGIDDQYD